MKWIRVKDKLPEDNEHVLVFDKEESICCGYIYLQRWSHHPIGSFAGDGCLFSVTHWMELPKEPEEE